MAPGPLEFLIIVGAILAGALLGLAIVGLLTLLLRGRRSGVAGGLSPGSAQPGRPSRQPKWY